MEAADAAWEVADLGGRRAGDGALDESAEDLLSIVVIAGCWTRDRTANELAPVTFGTGAVAGAVAGRPRAAS